MQSTLLIVSVILLIIRTGYASDDKYTTKYDNIDYMEIMKSDRLLKNYMNCLMERGSCTPDGAELKRVLPEALQTNCEKCSETQKDGTKKIIKFFVENKRDMFDELIKKYDPDNIYATKYHDLLESEGVHL